MKRNLQEEADSFQKFLNEWGAKHLAPEYAQKQQVSCGEKPSPVSLPAGGRGAVLEPAGIHLVPEPPAISLVIDELTFRSYAHNRRISPEISPERWAAIFGKEQVGEMEKRFQEEMEPPAIPEEPEWSDGMRSIEQYKDQGVK